MDEFYKNLSSASWWLSVVIVGILINLASALLFRKLDSRLSAISLRWRTRSKARKEQTEKRIAWLVANPSEQTYVATLAIRRLIIAATDLLVGLLSFTLASILILSNHPVSTVLSICFTLFIFPAIITSLRNQFKAFAFWEMIREARKRSLSEDPFQDRSV